MPSVTRRDESLYAPLEVLDAHFVETSDGPHKFREAWESLGSDEMEFVAGEIYKCKYDVLYYLSNYHCIKDEHGNAQTLYPLWPHQEIIYEVMEKCMKEKGWYRLIILKPRQCGGTVFSSGVTFHSTIFTERAFTLVMAQGKKTTAEMYRKIWDSYNSLPWWMRAERESKQQEVHIVFQREDEKERMADPGLASTMIISNAQEQAGIAIGRSIRFLHGSEVSRWPDSDIWTADIEPAMNARDTKAFLESTAYGRRGLFFHLWNAAEKGESEDWTPVFIPVYRVPKYFIPVMKSENFTLTEDEINLRDRVKAEENFTIKKGFFKWRRRKVKAAINSQGDERGEYSHQEAYPVTPTEAFISSGSCAFPRKCLNEQVREFCRDPILIGEIEYDTGRPEEPILHLHKPTHEECINKPKRENRLWVWELPDENAAIEYYIGSDVASGTAKDFSDASVYRIGFGQEQNVQVAEWHGWMNASYFARVLAALGYWYHTAEIAVEYALDGITTGNELRLTLDYPALYRSKHLDKLNTMTVYFHWMTNSKTRDDAINRMGQHLLDRTIVIRNKHTIQEMHDFGRFEGEFKAEGMDNTDDMVMANLIAISALYHSGKVQEWSEAAGIAGDGSRHAYMLPKTPQVFSIHNQFGQVIDRSWIDGSREPIPSMEFGNSLIAQMSKKSGLDLSKQWRVVPVLASRANTVYSPVWDSTGAEHELATIHGFPGQEQMKNPVAVVEYRKFMHNEARRGVSSAGMDMSTIMEDDE
jgi:hypothetical protein